MYGRGVVGTQLQVFQANLQTGGPHLVLCEGVPKEAEIWHRFFTAWLLHNQVCANTNEVVLETSRRGLSVE